MELQVNDPGTTLNGSITAIATTLIPASTDGYPGSGNFRIRIDAELLLVTGSALGVWTVTRGIEGTNSAAHTTGAAINAILTMVGLQQYVVQSTGLFLTGSSDPGSGIGGNNDVYLNITTGSLWGPKNGAWAKSGWKMVADV